MFQVCYRKTRHVSVHWKELGIQLKVEKYVLDEIDRDNPKDVVSCRLEMLSTWLKSDPADPEAQLDAALDDLQRTVHGEKSVACMKQLKKITCAYSFQLQELMSSK